MYTYIIKRKTGEIVSVNRSIEGCALELYGLDITKISESDASEDTLKEILSVSPSADCIDSEGQIFAVERHFLGA